MFVNVIVFKAAFEAVVSTWPMTENVGSIGLRASGGLIAALRRSHPEQGAMGGLGGLLPSLSAIRLTPLETLR